MTLIVAAMLHSHSATAQHTLSLIGGAGASYARFYPTEEIKMLWLKQGGEIIDCPRPLMHGGISWRYYSPKPRFVGAVGIDLEYMERGYKMGYAYTSEYVGEGDNRHEIRHYRYYTRYVNSVMLPFVWQPHVYVAKNKLRIFIDAAFVLSYNISSRYEYVFSYVKKALYFHFPHFAVEETAARQRCDLPKVTVNQGTRAVVQSRGPGVCSRACSEEAPALCARLGGKFSTLEHLSRVHRCVKSLPALARNHPLLSTRQTGRIT